MDLTGRQPQGMPRLSFVIDLDGTPVRGRTVAPGAADIVLLGRDMTFSYERPALAVKETRRGASA